MKREPAAAGELTYTRFRQQVSEGNVAELTIRDGRRVAGRLERPVGTDRGEVTRFRTRLPAEPDPALLDRAYQTCERVLSENRELLQSLADALLERETLDADDVRRLAEGEELGPPPVSVSSGEEAAGGTRPEEGTGGGEPSPALA